LYKSTAITVNGYNVLVEWSDPDPNPFVECQQAGKKNIGGPLKILLDCCIETERGHKA
jgi:hypothetical protein